MTPPSRGRSGAVDSAYLDRWAKGYASHNSDNPGCYDGTCRCSEILRSLGRELLQAYGVKGL